MKKLPKIYQNEITKKIRNNKEICYLKDSETIKTHQQSETIDISKTLNTIFNSLGQSYNIPVVITTKDKEYVTGIVAKTKDNIITLDNDLIPLEEIINIEIKKKVQ